MPCHVKRESLFDKLTFLLQILQKNNDRVARISMMFLSQMMFSGIFLKAFNPLTNYCNSKSWKSILETHEIEKRKCYSQYIIVAG